MVWKKRSLRTASADAALHPGARSPTRRRAWHSSPHRTRADLARTRAAWFGRISASGTRRRGGAQGTRAIFEAIGGEAFGRESARAAYRVGSAGPAHVRGEPDSQEAWGAVRARAPVNSTRRGRRRRSVDAWPGRRSTLRMRQNASFLRHRAGSTFRRLDIKINSALSVDPAKQGGSRCRDPSIAET